MTDARVLSQSGAVARGNGGTPRRMCALVAVTALVATTAPVVLAGRSASSSAQRFKSEVLMISVEAVVLDAQGHSVTDLSRSDFNVLEDGVRQDIAEFTAVEWTPRAGLLSAVPRPSFLDVATNEGMQDGRLFVLVLDDLQTLRGREDTVRHLALQMLQRLGADDLVAVACTSGSPACGCDLTRDRAAVRASVDHFTARKSRFDREDPLRGPLEALNLGKGFGQLDTLQTLTGLANRLVTEHHRRKVLLYVGEGIDTDLRDEGIASSLDPSDFERSAFFQARNFTSAARRANVVLYALDPRGRTHYGEEGFIRQPGADDFEPWLDRAQVARQGLQWLAEETGGFAATGTTDFDDAVDRILRESGTYYLLGYYSSNQNSDAGFRTILVEVEKPGLRVRARRGYFAPNAGSRTKPAVVTP